MFRGRWPVQKIMLRLFSGLARWQRRRLSGLCVIGVTGSAGKTTTKDLLHAILQTRLIGRANRLTYNRPHHIVRRLLTTTRRDAYLVQEISVEQPGGMDEPLRLLQPRIGVITCIGFDHYSAFRGPENVAREKGKLVRALPADGWAILNADDPLVLAMREGTAARVMTFGQQPGADLLAGEVVAAWPERLSFTASHGGERVRIQTQMVGAHWLPSLLAALAAARAMGVTLGEAAPVMQRVVPAVGRMSPVEHPDGVTFIRDDWKAPLWSVATVVDFMRQARATRKILVFGTFSDFPGDRARKYQKVAREALAVADLVIFVGAQAHMVEKVLKDAQPGALMAFPQLQQAHDFLKAELRHGDLVVLKGSNMADHLARLVFARETPIACWREKCGRSYFCNRCSLLRKR